MWVFAVFITTVFLAYANGANDNFKGVATLFGSQTTSYKVAIWWATATTFAGSICSVMLASALLASPLIASVLGIVLYSLLHHIRAAFKIEKAWCVCVGNTQELIAIDSAVSGDNLAVSFNPNLAIDTQENCSQRYIGSFWGIDSQKLVDVCHFLSAGAVSFARGLNDTPKIVALLLGVTAFSIRGGMFAVGLGMAIGGLLNARKVAMTVSNKITTLNSGKGLAANIVTGFLVIFASRMGVPVSTTHASVGSIFGMGIVSNTAHIGMFSKVLSSWFLTLPIAAIFSGLTYFLLSK